MEKLLCSPSTHHHEQHCDCSRVIQITESDHWAPKFLRTKDPAEAVFPSPAEEVQPATRAVDTVLLCHRWIRPLHVNICLVQLSYQIWPQKTTEGSPDCWANHCYNPPHSPRTVLIQSEQKAWQNHYGSLEMCLCVLVYHLLITKHISVWFHSFLVYMCVYVATVSIGCLGHT